MSNLILTLLATSSVDSLNPIGITQQFILQGMVKKPRHIWYFIITTAIVNIIFGYIVYYGIIEVFDKLFHVVIDKYGLVVYSLEILLALVMLFFCVRYLVKKIKSDKRGEKTSQEKMEQEEKRVKEKIKHVTPLALINIGIISTASELTSALPYFAFLAVLVTYKLSFFMLTLVLIFYNIIYIAPFVLLFIIYILSQEKFDRVYKFFREKFGKYFGYLISLLVLVIVGILMYNGIGRVITLL